MKYYTYITSSMTFTMVLLAEIKDTISEISHLLPQETSKTRDKIKHGKKKKESKELLWPSRWRPQSWVQGSDSQHPTAWHWHRKAHRLNKLDFPLQITVTQIKNGTNSLLTIFIHQDVTKCQRPHFQPRFPTHSKKFSSFKATVCMSTAG